METVVDLSWVRRELVLEQKGRTLVFALGLQNVEIVYAEIVLVELNELEWHITRCRYDA